MKKLVIIFTDLLTLGLVLLLTDHRPIVLYQ